MQAVIVIHGMGEQVPMGTLQGVVDAVWTHDSGLTDSGKPDPNTGEKRTENVSWSKPDEVSNSFELRRITTESDKARNRTDFFEFYWAHQVQQTTAGQLLSWIKTLLFRDPRKDVPRGVLGTWIVLWVIALLTSFSLVYPLFVQFGLPPLSPALHILITGGGMAIWYVISRILVKNFGDVARYVQAAPYNVHTRQQIREQGVALLERLLDAREDDEDYKYDRVVVLAHSLGTIVAYDILTHAFARRNTAFSAEGSLTEEPRRAEMEEMIRDAESESGFDIDDFRKKQDEVRAEYNDQGGRWVVSDFVTLGSPLTHAEFLMARDKSDLEDQKMKRTYPTCPPFLEYDGVTKLQHFTYRFGGVTQQYYKQIAANSEDKKKLSEVPETPRTPHHAALFAYTRWTNLYSPLKLIVLGDVISGPLADTFGYKNKKGAQVKGIKDVPVMPGPGTNEKTPFFSHTKYWRLPPNPDKTGPKDPAYHLAQLRKALRLIIED